MTWRRIQCSACGWKLVIGTEELADLVMTNAVIGCTVAHCVGSMHPIGRIIIRRRTAESGPSYAFQIARRAVKRNHAQISYAEESDDEEDGSSPAIKRAKTSESDDDAWAPSEQYTPAMRFTVEDMENNFRQVAPFGLTVKQLASTCITAALRGEREKQTKAVMGGIVAWQLARKHGAPNAGAFALGSRGHYEWCHLQAVSLGGRTVAANLFAGHYALNTCMAVVEEHIRGKTHLEVGVDVHCSQSEVADYVVYSIYRARDHVCLLTLNMDGRMTCFSTADRDRLKDRLKQAGI